MPEELGTILDKLKNLEEKNFGDLKIYSGEWINSGTNKIFITCAWSGWGKVSAARATTRISSYIYNGEKIDCLLFTGVAGAAKKGINIWDVVIADSLIQYDMDARPLFKKFEIPALKNKILNPPQYWLNFLFDSIEDCKKNQKLSSFGELHMGLIGTGDRFVSDKSFLKELTDQLPDLMAVEMEGAAFAQVASQEKINWIILRVISDSADESADIDFNKFLEKYKCCSWDLIDSFLKKISNLLHRLSIELIDFLKFKYVKILSES